MSKANNLHLREYFIWTEALGCGEILAPMISSYLAHHNHKIHIIGYKEDLAGLPSDPRIVPVRVDEHLNEIGLKIDEVRAAYNFGHRGTALVWTKVILHRKEEFLIHLDADNIFLGDVVNQVLIPLEQGYSIVGTRRPYRHRLSASSFLYRAIHYFRRDCVNTHCFGFNRNLIKIKELGLRDLIEGRQKNKLFSRMLPVIDFFDGLTFYLASKGSGVFYLDSDDQSRHGHHSRDGKLESNLISFAAVGSGSAFYKNKAVETSESYRDFALRSYSLFSSHLIGIDIDYPTLDSPYILNLLERLDKSTWTIK